MANMTVADRTKVWRGLMRRWSKDAVSCAFLKYDLYNPGNDTGAVADVDVWVDTHNGTTSGDSVGMNGALTVGMRSAMLADQKADLLIGVVAMRRGVEYLRSVFGDID